MKFTLLILLMPIMFSKNPEVIVDFNENTAVDEWLIVDDVVMGGQSSGKFSLSDEGHGVFEGNISLANNGGFSSVRHSFEKINVEGHKKVVLKLKGDGKRYQLRIKTKTTDYYSYVSYFNTSGEWEEIEIPLQEMHPTFRGRKLDKPNFSSDHIEEIGILIGNKKEQSFKLLIDKIAME